MKILFELLPVVLFFVAFKWLGIFFATATAIVTTLLQIAYYKFRYGKVDTMLIVSGIVITVFGGATLIFKNPLFIQWKPSVLYWLFALGLLIAQYGYHINPLQKMLGAHLQLPTSVWLRLVWAWCILFAVLGALNLFVAFHYSQATWVNFKLFGVSAIMVLFVLAQAWYMQRHLPKEH